ncbi:MAG: hypothetical protein KGO94_05890 [Alphaproteobacteria bacterium]|nr:hypothetical protein [Alphaproteobacteria bacterium]
MAKTRLVKGGVAFFVLALFLLPLLASLAFAFQSGFSAEGWAALWRHPQLWPSLWLSLATGVAGTVLALIAALLIVASLFETRFWQNLSVAMGAMLAVPHVALAVALSFLIMPAGLIARIIGLFLQWQTPPQWVTTHDPFGIALTLALVLKETPFIIWVLAGLLSREDVKLNFANQRSAAFGLGHGSGSVWLRIFIPQLFGNLLWPLVIVFVYGATVVDMSLAIGPTQPPTLATIIWADINSEQVAHNARGAAGTIFISFSLITVLGVAWALTKTLKPLWRALLTEGPSTWKVPTMTGQIKHSSFIGIYALLLVLLVVLSLAKSWPFPQLWPETSFHSWGQISHQSGAVVTSLVLAFTASGTALILLVAWFETMPHHFDRPLLWASLALLGLPSLFVGLGQYQMFLYLGLTGTGLGLFLAHLLPVMAYMMIVLAQGYRAYDLRYMVTAGSLNASLLSNLLRIKWPMLKAQIWAAFAVGFAVSVVQYIPAQLVAAGRFSTLPMEVVTLTSGANRSLLAAFSLLLTVPPLLVYGAAALMGRSRWRHT